MCMYIAIKLTAVDLHNKVSSILSALYMYLPAECLFVLIERVSVSQAVAFI
jgi:hypothetical protein